MKNINQNVRHIGTEHKVIWSTDKEDVFIETWTESKEVDVGKLKQEKDELQKQIADMPDSFQVPSGKEQLQSQLNDKIALLDSYGINY